MPGKNFQLNYIVRLFFFKIIHFSLKSILNLIVCVMYLWYIYSCIMLKYVLFIPNLSRFFVMKEC